MAGLPSHWWFGLVVLGIGTWETPPSPPNQQSKTPMRGKPLPTSNNQQKQQTVYNHVATAEIYTVPYLLDGIQHGFQPRQSNTRESGAHSHIETCWPPSCHVLMMECPYTTTREPKQYGIQEIHKFKHISKLPPKHKGKCNIKVSDPIGLRT